MASNAFAVHGNHTASGAPLLSTDPHLTATLPSNWMLMGWHINENYMVGASNPGIPFIG